MLTAIGELHDKSRARIASTANLETVRTYWNTGRYIVEYEQHGSDRAKYGEGLIDRLARDLTLRRGARYTEPTLHAAIVERMKNFMLELGKGFAFLEVPQFSQGLPNPCEAPRGFD